MRKTNATLVLLEPSIMEKKIIRTVRKMIGMKPTAADHLRQFSELPSDVLVEIFTKLPIKKVYQLSCVSKLLRSVIIRSDFPQFYRCRNPMALVISVSDKNDSRHRFYYSVLKHRGGNDADDAPDEFVNSLNVKHKIRITETVDGFVFGFFKIRFGWFSFRSLSLLRVRGGSGRSSGGEVITRMIPDFEDEARFYRRAHYFLGYEPIDREYILFKISKPKESLISRIDDSNYYYDCQFLKLSSNMSSTNPRDNRWMGVGKFPVVSGTRRWLDPPYLADTQSFSFNGFIYWLINQQLLVSFQLRGTSFRSIKPPNYFPHLFMGCRFMHFRGQLALFRVEDEDAGLLPLYTMNDNTGESWTRQEIRLPCEVAQQMRENNGCSVIPVGNLPTGEILIAVLGLDDPFTPIYSYDYKNDGSFKRFVVGKFPDCAEERDDEGNIAAHIRFSVDDGFCRI